MVWYGGMVIYSGLIFILHMLLIFFIDMSLNILSFFIKFFIALFANLGSGGLSDIHLKSVQHRVAKCVLLYEGPGQRVHVAWRWRAAGEMRWRELPIANLYKQVMI
jgi:hypothetical protein